MRNIFYLLLFFTSATVLSQKKKLIEINSSINNELDFSEKAKKDWIEIEKYHDGKEITKEVEKLIEKYEADTKSSMW